MQKTQKLFIVLLFVTSLVVVQPALAFSNASRDFGIRQIARGDDRRADRRDDRRDDRSDDRKEKRRDFGDNIRDFIKSKIGSPEAKLRNLWDKKAILSGGVIAAIDGTTLTVTHDGKTYTVHTSDKTQCRRKFWGTGSVSEMQVGDTVNVIGKWEDDEHTKIKATLIRDLSIQKFHSVFFGSVLSVDGTGWVMSSVNRGDQTVTLSATTKLKNRKGEPITQSDIVVGHRVRVRGLWNKETNTITEVYEVKDFSLPVPSVTPTPTATPEPTATPTSTPTPTPTPSV